MKSVRGHYDGSVVVLDEPVRVSREVEVVVQFPEESNADASTAVAPRRWNWDISRARQDSLSGSVTDELFRQRRGD